MDFRGKTVGGCRLLSILGEGGMGVVYKAHHEGLDRPVVVKILHPHLASLPGFQDAFLREARSAARLEHPRIVQVYDRGARDGMHYIVMQLVDGETLEDLLKRERRLKSHRAVQILKAALEGLGEAHRLGIIHRDFKPSNILLGKDGSIRLSDFGLALKVSGSGTVRDSQIIGTPLYMAPEQIMGLDLDGRCDLYSIGATFFHMLVGEPPFDAPDANDVIAMHIDNPPPDPRKLAAGISNAAAEAILRLLAKKPEERFQSVTELLTALHSPAMVMESGMIAGERTFDLGIPTPEPRKRRPPPPGTGRTPFPAEAPAVESKTSAEASARGSFWAAAALWAAAGAASYWAGREGALLPWLAGAAVSAGAALWAAPRRGITPAFLALAGALLLHVAGRDAVSPPPPLEEPPRPGAAAPKPKKRPAVIVVEYSGDPEAPAAQEEAGDGTGWKQLPYRASWRDKAAAEWRVFRTAGGPLSLGVLLLAAGALACRRRQ